ncbi:hypothetical protein [Paenibacillus sp. N3.4]|uniref:hypothetical protein n=1 Tax=Paenibacillus sp. N3.4 TaxID=2603222 RepID=UPI0011CA5081|nr:hypothetical protein [Paenibacillus sp. N3.4]TXK83459.1 hypothetical protein FU659_13805 [Paenibacillus sp. N3.4]
MKATNECRAEQGLPLEKISMIERFSPVVKEYEEIIGVAGVCLDAFQVKCFEEYIWTQEVNVSEICVVYLKIGSET